jgi:type III secretory pathway component EscU
MDFEVSVSCCSENTNSIAEIPDIGHPIMILVNAFWILTIAQVVMMAHAVLALNDFHWHIKVYTSRVDIVLSIHHLLYHYLR